MKLATLPVYYYLDHFVEMLDFVEKTYGEILTDEHRSFTARFRALSKDAQWLLIRMVNRRGAIFNRALFQYPEITDLETAARRLIERGDARGLRVEGYSAFVLCLPKTALLDGARAAEFGRDVRTLWSKPVLADFFVATIPFDLAAKHCAAGAFIALDNMRPIEFLLYLYFGKTTEDLKTFALRDLGVLRTNRETSFSARFADADEAHACFHYSQVLDRIRSVPLISTSGRLSRSLMDPGGPRPNGSGCAPVPRNRRQLHGIHGRRDLRRPQRELRLRLPVG